jgi:heme exporter protein CcmD
MKDFFAFLAMGGYGVFVWSAYGIVFLVLIYQWIEAVRRKNHDSRA